MAASSLLEDPTLIEAVEISVVGVNMDSPVEAELFQMQSLDRGVDAKVEEVSEAPDDNERLIHESCSIDVDDGQSSIEMPYPCSERIRELQENIMCRICRDTPDNMGCIKPCLCKGSMEILQTECLESWLSGSGYTSCDVCGFEYAVITERRYSGFSSIVAWLKMLVKSEENSNYYLDSFSWLFFTLVVTGIFWICVEGAKNFIRTGQLNPHTEVSLGSTSANSTGTREGDYAAHWCWVVLIMLTSISELIYITWIFIIREHYRLWNVWMGKCIRNRIVSLLPILSLPENELQEHENLDQLEADILNPEAELTD